MATHKALVLHQYNGIPVLQDHPIPKRKQGQLLVKVEASTINPVDKLIMSGNFHPLPLPTTVGGQGTGKVIEADQAHKDWIGKRVSFLGDGSGVWGQFALASPEKSIIISQDIPLTTAASGFVNPLTAFGIVHTYESYGFGKGLILTAASSTIGRMLIKYGKRKGIPILSIVRKQEQADLLKSEGAQHIVVTQGQWQKEYAAEIGKHGFNILFDCLGGGPVIDALIGGLPPQSVAHIYGGLEGKPFQISRPDALSRGVNVTGYTVFAWLAKISKEEMQKIRQQYSNLLKGDFSIPSYKVIPYSEIALGLEEAATKASIGKVTLIPK